MPGPKRIKTIILVLLICTVGIVAVVLTGTGLRGCADRFIDSQSGTPIEQKNPLRAIAAFERSFVIDIPEEFTDARAIIGTTHDNWTSVNISFRIESRLLKDFLESLPDENLKPYASKPVSEPNGSTTSTDKECPSWWQNLAVGGDYSGSFDLVWRGHEPAQSGKMLVIKTSESMATVSIKASFHGALKW